MRRTILLFLVAALIGSGAAFCLRPQVGDNVKALLMRSANGQSAQQSPPGQQSQAGQQPQGKSGRGGAGGGPVAVVTAAAANADFPVRRYAIGFVSSPAVVQVSARMSSQITAVKVQN